jgi:hypothetical protein
VFNELPFQLPLDVQADTAITGKLTVAHEAQVGDIYEGLLRATTLNTDLIKPHKPKSNLVEIDADLKVTGNINGGPYPPPAPQQSLASDGNLYVNSNLYVRGDIYCTGNVKYVDEPKFNDLLQLMRSTNP